MVISSDVDYCIVVRCCAYLEQKCSKIMMALFKCRYMNTLNYL